MTEEHAQAISFANSYFALVDGLASGLENHLAEDVVLDWFGRTIKGRQNVTAFIERHKVTSRHVFSNITPTPSIGYKEKRPNRKKFLAHQSRGRKDSGANSAKKIRRPCGKSLFRESKTPRRCEERNALNQSEIDARAIAAMDDMTYSLSEGDLSNLFKLEITSTSIEEIEQSINRIKLEEEMAPTIKAIKRECGQGDGPVVVETSTVKYVEANGVVEFSHRLWKRDMWYAYSSAMSNLQAWKRSCKLQIAYSIIKPEKSTEESRKGKNSTFGYAPRKCSLPSLDEINEISNRLVPNTNDFGGFLKQLDFFEDRNEFLESLEIDMEFKVPHTELLSPQYVENKLVFNKPCVNLTDCEADIKRKFVFNYQIHLIIYEGNTKCRMNLLQEFEKTD